MLRLIFVFSIILIGIRFAFEGPFYVLLFYLWNAYFRPEYWVWDPIVSYLDLSLGIGIILLIRSVDAFGQLRWKGRTLLIGLFFIQSLVSVLASEHIDWSWRWWTDFAKVLIVTLLITVLVSDRRRYRLTLLLIAYSLGFESVKQGWAQMMLNTGAANNNPHPMLGDNNGVAVGMMMLLPYFVALAQTSSRKWERYLHRFFIVGVVYRCISTYSRGGFVAAGAIGLVMLWYSPHKVRAVVLVGAMAFGVTYLMPDVFWNRMQTITAPAENQDEASEGRLTFWGMAVQMANAKPISGVGFNGFQRSFSAYDTSAGAYGGSRAVHSAWFGVLAEMGYPGLILFVLIIFGSMRSAWRLQRATRGDPAMKDVRAYASAMFASLVAYVVGMTFLNGQYLEMFWHLIGLGIALDHIYLQAKQEQAKRGASVVAPVRQAIGVAALAGARSPMSGLR